MEDKTYSMTLSDGTVLHDLKLNGNNYISTSAIDPAIFEGNCCPIIISDGSSEDTHPNMALVQVTTPFENEWWFILRDLTEAELRVIRDRADIEYLAMMCDVEL